MLADRPACHYSTNAAWDTFSSPYWGETEQAQVSCWQTLTLVWDDFTIAYFHVQCSLTFCKWQLVINWHHGSVTARREPQMGEAHFSFQQSNTETQVPDQDTTFFFKTHRDGVSERNRGPSDHYVLGGETMKSWRQIKMKALIILTSQTPVDRWLIEDCKSMMNWHKNTWVTIKPISWSDKGEDHGADTKSSSCFATKNQKTFIKCAHSSDAGNKDRASTQKLSMLIKCMN